jgi:hypothetical protein
MNVIFLDIDGVLVTPNYSVQAHGLWKQTNGWFKSRDEFGAIFDPMAIDCLVYLCDTTDSKVVVSSSWRSKGLKRMKDLFKVRGIPIDVIDITPMTIGIRGSQIEEWLIEHDDVSNYVILDDDVDFTDAQLKDHFVCTKGKYGFDHNALVKALKILIKRA